MKIDITDFSEWRYWQDFLNLATEKSFRFIPSRGAAFTCIKEQRKFFNKDKKTCWYAHRKIGGRLRRKYIGVAASVTHEKLSQAAIELAQIELIERTS